MCVRYCLMIKHNYFVKSASVFKLINKLDMVLEAGSLGSEVGNSWQKWIEQCDFYMKAMEKDSDVQVATLLTLLGAEAI